MEIHDTLPKVITCKSTVLPKMACPTILNLFLYTMHALCQMSNEVLKGYFLQYISNFVY